MDRRVPGRRHGLWPLDNIPRRSAAIAGATGASAIRSGAVAARRQGAARRTPRAFHAVSLANGMERTELIEIQSPLHNTIHSAIAAKTRLGCQRDERSIVHAVRSVVHCPKSPAVRLCTT